MAQKKIGILLYQDISIKKVVILGETRIRFSIYYYNPD